MFRGRTVAVVSHREYRKKFHFYQFKVNLTYQDSFLIVLFSIDIFLVNQHSYKH